MSEYVTKRDKYAAWLVSNVDKKGTDEFQTVASAYVESKKIIRNQEEDNGIIDSVLGGLATLEKPAGALRGVTQELVDRGITTPNPFDLYAVAKRGVEGWQDPTETRYSEWGMRKIEEARDNPLSHPILNAIGSNPRLTGALTGGLGTVVDFASDPIGLLTVGVVGKGIDLGAKGAKALKRSGADRVLKRFESKYYTNIDDGLNPPRAVQQALHDSGLDREILKELGKTAGRRLKLSSKPQPEKILDPMKITAPLRYLDDKLALSKAAKFSLVTMQERVNDISPAIGGLLRRSDMDYLAEAQRISNVIHPWTEKYKKLKKRTPNDARKLDKALFNSDFATAGAIMKGIDGMSDDFAKVRVELDSMYKRLDKTKKTKGDFIKDFFPRGVSNQKKLNEVLGKEMKDEISIAAAKAKAKKGGDLDAVEYEKVVSDTISRARIANNDVNAALSSEKARKIALVDDVTLPAYTSADKALDIYFNKATQTAQKREFFGRFNPDLPDIESAEALEKSVSGLMAAERNRGAIRGTQEAELEGLLRSRFGSQYMPKSLRGYKQMVQGLLLVNPSSAFTQVGDMALAAYAHGGLNALKASGDVLLNRLGKKTGTFDWDKMGGRISQEFADAESGGQILDKGLRLSGFRGVDKFAKDVHLNAAFRKYQSQIKTPQGAKQFAEKYQHILKPEEMGVAMKAIREGKHTPESRLVVLNDLLDMQPITMSNMPKGYADSPTGRILYTLKTFMMQQLNVVRKDSVRKIKSGQYEAGFGQLLRYGLVAGVAGNGGVEFTKNFIKGAVTGEEIKNQPDDLMSTADHVFMNMFTTIGVNRYLIDNAGRSGVGSAAVDFIAPPVGQLDALQELLTGDVEAAGKKLSGLTKLMVYGMKGMGVKLPDGSDSPTTKDIF